MKKLSVRLITTLLLAACSFTFACGDSSSGDVSTNSGDTTDANESPYDANGYLKDNLPADLNFGGETVTVYVRGDNLSTEFDAEQDGDIVNDAMFARNQAIEERLGVNLEYFANTSDDFWGDRNIFLDTVRTSVMANDGEIDIMGGVSSYVSPLATEGYLANVLELDYIDFDAPWWPETLREEMTVYDKMYLFSGDASLGVVKGLMCIFYNKDMITDYKLEDPYELVESGKWTLDKLNEMASKAVKDLNGNTTIDKDDQFGFIIQNINHAPNFLTANGVRFSVRNNEGIPELQLGSELVVDILDKVGAMMAQDGFYYKDDGKGDYANTFSDGRALFGTGEFGFAEQYREVGFDFGIIPFPLMEESSDPIYLTTARSTFTFFGILANADHNLCAAVMEAMASESYRTVTPAYYEKALKVKYSRDDESAQMFDLIRDGVTFDFAISHNDALDQPTVKIRNHITGGKTGWATTYASIGPMMEGLLTEILAAYESLD